MTISDHLIVGMIPIFAVPLEVGERSQQVLGMNEILPLRRQVLLFRMIESEELPETRTHPFGLRILEIPVPDAVQGSRLKKFENRTILSNQLIQLIFQIMLVSTHVRSSGPSLALSCFR